MDSLTDPWFLAVKAAVAASVAVLLTRMLGVSDALSAGFVAVACVTPTAYAGLRRAGAQVGGSLIGGAVATLLLLALPARELAPLVVLVAILASVLLCFRQKLAQGYVVAGFTVVYVVALPFPSAAAAVETRLASLSIGIAMATLTNLVVSQLASERILERRMRVARAHVGAALAAAAAASVDTIDAAVEPAFAIVGALRVDLAAARRELFAGRAAARLADRHLAEAIRLRTLLHFAKTRVLFAITTDALAAPAAALSAGTPLSDTALRQIGDRIRGLISSESHAF